MDLPDEVLDDVLRRVPPRHLAACRRVCKNWRTVIDGRGLVLTYLAPRPPRGIFINFFRKPSHSFFSRDERTSPCIGSTLRFLPDWGMFYRSRVLDHHNGLLLYANGDTMYVCNPVTRRWATLPPPPIPFVYPRLYLVFDPAVSLHYDVLYFPDVPERPKPPFKPHKNKLRKNKLRKGPSWTMLYTFKDIENLPPPLKSKYDHEVNSVGSMEWPPYSYAVQVFSSRTGQWQERHFTREGNAAVTVADVWSDPHSPNGLGFRRCHAVYWRGELYLHCRVDFVMRLSLLDRKYQVIKTPTFHNFLRGPRSRQCEKPYGYFGKSKQGIYYTAVHGYQLSVWVLHEASETCRTLEWELRHQADLEPSFLRYYNEHPGGDEIGKSWTLDPHEEESSDREDHGWDSGDDNVNSTGEEGLINSKDGYINCYYGMDFLGYHPDKEIVFPSSRYNGFAYYLGTSKLQYLGSLQPNEQYHIPIVTPTLESFIYTPCIDDLLPAHNDP